MLKVPLVKAGGRESEAKKKRDKKSVLGLWGTMWMAFKKS